MCRPRQRLQRARACVILPRQPKPRDAADLRAAWRAETNAARTARRAGDPAEEWRRLERAHILSQPLVAAHIRAHAHMLAFAVRHRDRHEVVGQVMRLAVAAPGTALRRYPLGNTGGANVSAVMPMDIPADLGRFLRP